MKLWVLFSLSSGKNYNIDSQLWEQWLDQFSYYKGQIYIVLERLIESIQLNHLKVIEPLSKVLTYRHPSQLIQSALEGGLVFLILMIVWLKPQKPGIIAGTFGLLYSFMRIVGEKFRMPDAHIGFEWFHLTRGQWLSFIILALGIIIFIYALRKKSKPHGGWLSKS